MILNTWGYTTWKYDPAEIHNRLNRVIKTLQYMRSQGIYWDALAVMGTSGIWLGPLLIMQGHKVVLIRKANERSHGGMVEGQSNEEITRLVFIDDLICSGDTIRKAQKQLTMFYERYGKGHPAMITAIVLHDTQMGYHDKTEQDIPVYGYIEE